MRDSDDAAEPAQLQLSALNHEAYLKQGLAQNQVDERLQLKLTNLIDSSPSRRWSEILRANIFTLFNLVVGGAFLLLLLLGQWQDALFGFAVVANVLIGITQEYRSKRTLDKLALLTEPKARVLRDGVQHEIGLENVVLDDLVLLRSGDQVIADSIVIAQDDLELDESLLTGESEPVLKSDGSALLSGSIVLAGSATTRVVKVGSDSYASRISLEARRFSLVNSELRNSLNRIIRWISIALLPMMAIAINGQFQAVGGVENALATGSWLEAAVKSIASIISMVPQGLVLITSISFAIAALKLARSKVLVQELPAVEGLARVDIICFDKTGTLTEGDLEFVEFENSSGATSDLPSAVLATFAWDDAANATALAMRAQFASELAFKTSSTQPFSSSKRWGSVSREAASSVSHDSQAQSWLMGAPEILLASVGDSAILRQRAEELTRNGNRVLALVSSVEPKIEKELPDHLQPEGLLVFRETIRGDAHETLVYFARQGVDVRIISGDNPATVLAVANRAGLNDTEAVDGASLPEDPAELDKLLSTHRVFGRVSPEQKLNMVRSLQQSGRVVAMTGDGVNDALALKQADLGIAMGNAASATKAVSRLVLLGNQFSALPGVVGEGRKVIANVERVSRLFLTKTVWAMMLAVVFGILLWSFPFLPRQLSATDGYTIGIPAFFLALLANQARYQPGFLRRALWFCIPSGLVVASGIIALNFLLRTESSLRIVAGISLEGAQTATAVLMSIAGLWVLATLTRPLTGLRALILLAMVLLGTAVFLIPPIADFFGFVELGSETLVVTLAISTAVCLLLEVVHQLIQLRQHVLRSNQGVDIA
ncbi:MAG: hypothetical protein RL198_545 [Actinomycetota bacterium]